MATKPIEVVPEPASPVLAVSVDTQCCVKCICVDIHGSK